MTFLVAFIFSLSFFLSSIPSSIGKLQGNSLFILFSSIVPAHSETTKHSKEEIT